MAASDCRRDRPKRTGHRSSSAIIAGTSNNTICGYHCRLQGVAHELRRTESTNETVEQLENLKMGMIKEFKEFALKGNMVDMAVGIIIGGAFGIIIKSLIGDVIMPLVGKIIGDVDFTNIYIPLSEAVSIAKEANPKLPLAEAQELGSVMAIGNFGSILINFFILAFVIFIMVKMMNKAKAQFEKEAEEAPPAAPAADIVLLTEIRDALKARG